MMLYSGPLDTIYGHMNLTQYENICIEYLAIYKLWILQHFKKDLYFMD